jgi:hypothetical protein
MKTAQNLAASVSLFALFIFFSESFSQQSKTAKGTIKEIDTARHTFSISDSAGKDYRFDYNLDTKFISGKTKVSSDALKQGQKAVVIYGEKDGEPNSQGWALLINLATEVRLDASAAKSKPAPKRFKDNGNGTVTDVEKKLMWQYGESGNKLLFSEAQQYCKSLKLGGYSGWRLPSIDEHEDAVVTELMMPKRTEGDVADWYWSNESRFLIPFNYPVAHIKTSALALGKGEGVHAYCRCVRNLTIPPKKKSAKE